MTRKLLLLLCSFPLLTSAQISLTAQIPSGGLIPKNQIWNLLIIDQQQDLNDMTMRIIMKDALSGEVVLTATSSSFFIPKGVKVIRADAVEPVQYNYLSPSFAKSLLPPGKYIICYDLTNHTKEIGIVAKECVDVEAEPLSPPQLIFPADKSEISVTNPVFTWLPPAPANLFDDLSYEISVTEILPGQSSTEAIQQNLPLYIKSGLTKPLDLYPASYGKLERGKHYAWQVKAINANNYSVKTESWRFKVIEDSVDRIISMAPFNKISRKPDQVSVAHQGFLKLELFNESTDSTGLFTVKNTKSGKAEFTFSMVLIAGQNFIVYDMNKHRKLKQDEVYEVLYTDTNNATSLMKFIPVYYR